MTTAIRMAMIGCGQIATAHLKAIDTVTGTHVTWCQDIDGDRAAAAAGPRNARHTTDYAEVLAADDVDAVFLCLPHDLHEPCSVQAAAAGKHVLVEKPMALNETEAQRMIDAAQGAGVTLCVGQSTRCMAGMRQAHALLADGAIGRVHHVMHQRAFFVDSLSTDWRRVESECGGLYLPLFGSHDVDAALWLMSAAATSPARPAKVWSSLRATSQASGGDSDGILCLDFADGRLASFQFSVCSRQQQTETILVGTDGTLSIKDNRVRLNGEMVDAALPANVWADSFTEQMRQFVAGLQGEGPLPAPGDEVLTVVRILDLARAASVDGVAQSF
jgi:predicted dehydrogenase